MSISSVAAPAAVDLVQQVQSLTQGNATAQSQTAAQARTTAQPDPTQQAVQAHHHGGGGEAAPAQAEHAAQVATPTSDASLLNKVV